VRLLFLKKSRDLLEDVFRALPVVDKGKNRDLNSLPICNQQREKHVAVRISLPVGGGVRSHRFLDRFHAKKRNVNWKQNVNWKRSGAREFPK
jgi:hypothetical protein